MPDRRAILALAAGALAGAGGVSAALFGRRDDDAPVSPAGLRVHAARKGLSFGCAVDARQLAAGGPYPKVIVTEADTVVPGIAMKWGETEQHRGLPDYGAAESIAAFAAANGLRLRGHTAFWYRNIPAWARPLLTGPDGPGLMLAHARAVVGHFRGRVFEWDVINEAIEPLDGLPGLYRKQPFGRAPGIGYLADLFAAAHDADPAARLFYNDYLLEGVQPYEQQKRRAVLDMLAALKRRGAPVHGLGVQSHLATHLRFDPPTFRAFLGEVAAMGLEIRLTELDITDRKASGTIAQRDQQVADLGRRFLDAAFDERAVRGLIAWGVRDRDIVPLPQDRRSDGLPLRSLPFDDQFRRKPLWTAIARAFDAAPVR